MAPGKKHNSGQKSFTLVEMVVAMAVLILMVALLAQALSSTQTGFMYLGNSALRRQDAGTVLANMAKDLRASLQPMNRSYEGADPVTGQFQLLINPPGVPINSGFCNPNTIFWSASDPNTVGGTGLVGYFVQWGTTPSGAPQPLLCRMFLNSAQAAPQLALLEASTTTTNQWANTALATNYAPADLNDGYQGWLADNVLALYARALDPGLNPITTHARTITGVGNGAYNYEGLYVIMSTSTVGTSSVNQYDSRQGYQYVTSGNTTNVYGPVLPAAIELAIVVAEPKDISRLVSPVYASSTYDATKDMWTNVNTFMTSLPSSLRKSARAYSTIVMP
jgi:type II secretory pathway pseudopilin PulG